MPPVRSIKAKFTPLSPDQVAALSEDDLAEYEEALEEAFFSRGKTNFFDYCQMVELPGAPIDDSDTSFFPEKVIPAAHHRLIIDAIQKMADGQSDDVDGLMVFMPPGSAKALALDTPIPTPGGWRQMGDLQIGDRVFDENGNPCNVVGVSPVWKDRPVYRVTTDCGDEIIADRDHEWLVRLCGKPRRPMKKATHGPGTGSGRSPMPNRDDPMSQFKIKETWQLSRKRSKRPMIKRAGALNLPAVDLPIDPYFLGVWLGDGTSSTLTVTSSLEDQPWLRGELERLGYKTTDRSVPTLFAIHGVRAKFASLGLINDPRHGAHGKKYIPQIYMRASRHQRLALLQGLIDTDGTVCKRQGCATFCNTDIGLAQQVRELVCSLGVKAGWSESPAMLNGKFCGMAYKVSFYLKDAARMPRKAKLCRDQYRTPDTYVDAVPAGVADTVCIEVDSPSHLFLAGRSMTPTHNSSYVSVLATSWLLGRRPGTNVVSVSYGQDLADRNARKTRQIVRSADFQKIMGCEICGDNQAISAWSLTNGSDFRGAGLTAGVTGYRGNWAVVDDPLKGREAADSLIIRDKAFESLVDEVFTRLKPGGKILMCLTRWSEDDPAGRLLGKWDGQSGLWRGTDGRLWQIINLPLLAEHADDPLGRKPGELLWPEWFKMKEALRLKEAAKKGGTYARSWSSLWQQRPAPNEGAILARSYWREWTKKDAPECSAVYLTYDTAFEEDEQADFSAMAAWGVFEHVSRKPGGEEYRHNHIILLGAWQDKVSAVDLIDTVQGHAKLFQPDRILVEKRASGIQLIQEMQRRRLPVKAWLPKGKPGTKGKVPRAHAVAAILEGGSVWYVPGPKTEMLIEQCAAFPYATNDDLVDVATMAISYFRDKWIFRSHEDELDPEELKEELLRRSDSNRRPRSLYSGPVTRASLDIDESDIERMTPETRRRLYS